MAMELYPAIDLRGGRVVRLLQGDYDQETDYGDDPVAVAKSFAEQGAAWIHVVDLDAARGDGPVNAKVIAAIAASVDVSIQASGGVVDDTALRSGVKRVVVGTMAVRAPDVVTRLARKWPGQVAVGLDARDGQVAVRGWTEQTGVGVDELLKRYADGGVAAFILTDIARDGMFTGPDVDGLRAALEATATPVIASGGVADVGDLHTLAALEVSGRRLAGAIVGRAIHDGRFTVADGVAACRRAAPSV